MPLFVSVCGNASPPVPPPAAASASHPGAESAVDELGRAELAQLRVATFNTSLNRDHAGKLIEDLSTGDNPKAQTVAEIIQRVRPDILLLNEFDWDDEKSPGSSRAAQLFQDNYLSDSQHEAEPIRYPYVYVPTTNTGIASGFDLDNNGEAVDVPGSPAYANDAQGFGRHPGQYGMLLLSQYPFAFDQIRTFQTFLWRDMPGAMLPDNLDTPEPDDFYSPEELAVLRLSSKNHCDVPVQVGDTVLHVLIAHPTPPVFDGPEDHHGRRNHDEVRLWADYLSHETSSYITDDEGHTGGLADGERFVILGDYNADPFDGDSTDFAIRQLLEHPRIDASHPPPSEGARTHRFATRGPGAEHQGDPAHDTADFSFFGKGPGNLRVDYVLPSRNGLKQLDAGVFWPVWGDPLAERVEEACDHRLVSVELEITH